MMGSVWVKKVLFVYLLLVFILGFAGAVYADELVGTFDRFYGQVKDDLNNPVPSGTIEAYIDGEKRGELAFQNGQYGIPVGDPFVEKLIVNGTANDIGKQIQFKVKIGGATYTAQTNPGTVNYQGSMTKRQVILTITIPNISINGFAVLQRISTSVPADDSGTQVKATQGGSVVGTFVTAADGSYTVTGVSAGSCTLEFSHTGGSWKTTTKTVTVEESGSTDAGSVALFLGDMNGDGAINILDLLWMASVMGPASGDAAKADVNGDGQVNILDLLKVAANIGK